MNTSKVDIKKEKKKKPISHLVAIKESILSLKLQLERGKYYLLISSDL